MMGIGWVGFDRQGEPGKSGARGRRTPKKSHSKEVSKQQPERATDWEVRRTGTSGLSVDMTTAQPDG
jgi:hypothetical protein